MIIIPPDPNGMNGGGGGLVLDVYVHVSRASRMWPSCLTTVKTADDPHTSKCAHAHTQRGMPECTQHRFVGHQSPQVPAHACCT